MKGAALALQLHQALNLRLRQLQQLIPTPHPHPAGPVGLQAQATGTVRQRARVGELSAGQHLPGGFRSEPMPQGMANRPATAADITRKTFVTFRYNRLWEDGLGLEGPA